MVVFGYLYGGYGFDVEVYGDYVEVGFVVGVDYVWFVCGDFVG